MPLPVQRQTLIALKSRRTAFRVVSDFLHHNKADVRGLACACCGRAIEERLRNGKRRRCASCTRIAHAEPWEEPLTYEPEVRLDVVYDYDEEADRRVVSKLFVLYLLVGFLSC